MPRYTIEPGPFGNFETLQLKNTDSGEEAVIALYGATLLSLTLPLGSELMDVTDGFQTPEELENGKGGRAWVMAPFTNRVDAGKYAFAGAQQQLNVTHPETNVAMHGFVHSVDFEVVKQKADDASAAARLRTGAIRRGEYEGYPFDVDVEVSFELKPGRLDVSISGRNLGTQDVPFGCGWHPYFVAGAGQADGWNLQIPAREKIVTDDRLLPVAGDGAYIALDVVREFDYREARSIGGAVLDTAFYNLTADDDGWIRTKLSHPQSGGCVTVCQERGLMHVFTGDTLPARARAAVALEPVEFMTNVFNRPEHAGAVLLPAQGERTFRFAVEAR